MGIGRTYEDGKLVCLGLPIRYGYEKIQLYLKLPKALSTTEILQEPIVWVVSRGYHVQTIESGLVAFSLQFTFGL